MDLLRERYQNFLAWMAANGLNPNRVAERAGMSYTTIKSYVDKDGAASMRGDNEARIAASFGLPVEAIFGAPEVPAADRQENHLGEWRDRAGLAQEDVASALGVSLRIIEQLEAGEIDCSAKWLTRLADLYGTNPGLLFVSPEQANTDLVQAARAVPDNQKSVALKVLQQFTGTDG